MTDLKPILRERGLRQKAVAQAIGVSEATVSSWVAALASGNHERVPAEKAKRLASMLGVAPSVIRPDLWPATPEAA
jgi:DNA-binding transcriptional regulator YdaS (Cro superfamily)